MERRGWVIHAGTVMGQLATGGTRWFWRRAAALKDGTSRVTGDCQARICEGLGVKFPGPTRRVPRAKQSPTRKELAAGKACSMGFFDRSLPCMRERSGTISVTLVFAAWVSLLPASTASQESIPRRSIERGEQIVTAAVPMPLTGVAEQVWSSAAPDDADRLLVCTFESDGGRARHVSAAYVSLDGGSSWVQTLLDDHSEWVSETSCASGREGKAYFAAGVSDTSLGEPRHQSGTTEIYRSLDGGLHWATPHGLPFLDWTTLVAGNEDSSSKDDLFLFGHRIAGGVGDHGNGTWIEQVRAGLVSHDGGRSFSPPIYPLDQGESRRTGTFPISAVVRSDGSVLILFAEGTGPEATERGLVLYRLDYNGYRKVSTIPLAATFDYVEALGSQMTVNRTSSDSERLYVSLPAVQSGRAVLGLAVSDDLGKTWRTNILLRGEETLGRGAAVSSVAGVAVNKDGTVGIEWLRADGCPIFATSMDGGASVIESNTLGTCKPGDSGTSLSAAAASKMTGWNSPSAEATAGSREHLPGFTFRVDTSALVSLRISADRSGRFHVFWPEVEPDGSTTFLTATIERRAIKAHEFYLTNENEVTDHCAVEVTRQRFDTRTGTFAIDAVIKNISDVSLVYPRILEIHEDVSDCGKIRYLNSAGFSSEGKVIFGVPTPPEVTHLRPGAATLPVHMQIQVQGCEASQGSLFERSRGMTRGGKDWFYALSASVRVFEKSN